MGAIKAVPSQNFIQKTLDAALLTGITASVTLNNVTGIQNLPGVFIVDRVDSNGVETPSRRETVGFTAISGVTLTTLTRALAGSTDQDHAVGAIVEFSADVVWAQSIYDALSQVVTPSTGLLDTSKIASPSGATLTAPVFNFGSGATGAIYYEGGDKKVNRLLVGATHSFLVATGSLPAWKFISGASGSVMTSNGSEFPVFAPAAAGGGTGGFNATFNIPGGLASLSAIYPGVGGGVIAPTTFTMGLMNAYVNVASSNASVGVVLFKNNAQVGVLGIAAGGTFGSSASFSNTSLVAGDLLSIGINSFASLAQNLSFVVRAT